LHIKLVKLQSINLEIRLWPDLSFQIWQNLVPAGLEDTKSCTALLHILWAECRMFSVHCHSSVCCDVSVTCSRLLCTIWHLGFWHLS